MVQLLQANGRAEAIDELTVGAPRSAREALVSGAISLEALRSLRAINPSWGVRDLALTAGEILAVPLLYMFFPNPVTFVVCILWTIRNLNSCAQIVHETDHSALFRTPRLNNLMGNICAHVVGYTRYGHRQAHMDHHLYLNTDRDPDIIFSQPDASGREILRGLLKDLFLISAIQRFLQYFQPSDKKTYTVSPWKNLTPRFFMNLAVAFVPVAIVQLILLGVYTATIGPAYYLLFHILPIMTIYPVQIRIRSISEHSFALGQPPGPGEPVWQARTSKLNWFEWFIMAPLYQNYHYEHHVFPTIPNHNLPVVHKMLFEAGIPVPRNSSYIGFVLNKIRADLAHA